jgi:hypothetical protein
METVRIRDGKKSDPGSGTNIPDLQHCAKHQVADPDPHGAALIFVGCIRIRTRNADPQPGGQKMIHKNRKK